MPKPWTKPWIRPLAERRERAGLGDVPRPALILGGVGLLPFVAGAAAMVWGTPTIKLNVYLRLAEYAAICLVFLGAVHWGLAMAAKRKDWAIYLTAIAPVPVAALALFLVPPMAKYGLLIISYFIMFMMDLRAVDQGLAPDWYRALRKPLTIGVLLTLGVVLGAVA